MRRALDQEVLNKRLGALAREVYVRGLGALDDVAACIRRGADPYAQVMDPTLGRQVSAFERALAAQVFGPHDALEEVFALCECFANEAPWRAPPFAESLVVPHRQPKHDGPLRERLRNVALVERMAARLDPAAPQVQSMVLGILNHSLAGEGYGSRPARASVPDAEAALMSGPLVDRATLHRYWLTATTRRRRLGSDLDRRAVARTPGGAAAWNEVRGAEARGVTHVARWALGVAREEQRARDAFGVHARIAQRLAQAGIDLDAPASAGFERHSILQVAVYVGSFATVGALLSVGADPNARVGDGLSPAEVIECVAGGELDQSMAQGRAVRARAALRQIDFAGRRARVAEAGR